jgi:glutathione S-transferase
MVTLCANALLIEQIAMLQLVQLPVSLYCFKVRLALAAMHVEIPMIEPHQGSYRSNAYRALVPTGTIPALLGPDGILTETDAIIEYLDETRASSRLMHGTAARRARIRMVSRVIDLRLEPAVRLLFSQVAPAQRKTDEVSRARDLIASELTVIEWALDLQGPFAIDASISMADCALAATSTWLDALRPDLLPGLVLPPRFERVKGALRTDPTTGPVLAAYQTLVAGWVDARRSS